MRKLSDCRVLLVVSKKLAKRTLTNLCNERPAWLANALSKLDVAVAATYGFDIDPTGEQVVGLSGTCERGEEIRRQAEVRERNFLPEIRTREDLILIL